MGQWSLKERLQPSLLDRLTDLQPDKTEESVSQQSMSQRQFKEAVIRDLGWLLKAGGFLGGKHPSAGFFNAGEKIWFWIAIIGGLVLSVTGLILVFSILGQSREIMGLSHVLHGIAALIVISVSFGHIYLGTAGVEGTLGSMTTGYVDEAWAKSHHDRWYAEVKAAENSSETTVDESGLVAEGKS